MQLCKISTTRAKNTHQKANPPQCTAILSQHHHNIITMSWLYGCCELSITNCCELSIVNWHLLLTVNYGQPPKQTSPRANDSLQPASGAKLCNLHFFIRIKYSAIVRGAYAACLCVFSVVFVLFCFRGRGNKGASGTVRRWPKP